MTRPEDPTDIAEVLVLLAQTIAARKEADPEGSYTARLLTGHEDKLLKKIGEEAAEVIMAAKDADREHLAYEAGDLVYHLLVVLERHGVTTEELARSLADRMK